MNDLCNAIGGKCMEGPKRHHKCKMASKRAGPMHPMHTCFYCGLTFE